MNFDLDSKERKRIFNLVFGKIEQFYNETKDLKITPNLDVAQIRTFVNQANLKNGIDNNKAIELITKGLESYSVHTPHPNYFGLFNPRSNFAGIIADIITASYNPQLAAWSHAPYAVEVEKKVIQDFCKKFGYEESSSDGVFTSGGAEANLTATLTALNHKYPAFARDGVFNIGKKPIIFCSEEAHHSVQKSAKAVGLGYDAVKTIKTFSNLKINVEVLEESIKESLANDEAPLMVIATAGTTGTGTIDSLEAIRAICNKHSLWFHVDAAWGGAAILSENLKKHLKGIEHSDSITFDAHKWMSVPMGTSMFLTKDKEILSKTFRITTEYMPKEANELDVIDPFTHSIQWSRRFIGLKVYLSLLFYGWEGYQNTIEHQAQMGILLKKKLTDNHWVIKNNTPLPVVCFTDEKFANDANFTKKILNSILKRGKSWLSVYPINGVLTFRACITNYNTTELELDELINELNKERKDYSMQ